MILESFLALRSRDIEMCKYRSTYSGAHKVNHTLINGKKYPRLQPK